MRWLGTTVVVGLLALWPAVGARAQAEEDASARMSRGEAAERALDFGAAEREYRAALAADGGSRLARRARSRLARLEARRDPDGGYASLATLERLRRGRGDPSELRGFERDVDEMTNETARREALFVLAEAWARRRGEPARAIPFYERILADRSAAPAERRIAAVGLAEAHAALGDSETALRELDDAGLSSTFEGRELRTADARRARRLPIALVLALCVALLAGFGRPWAAGRSGLRRALSPARALAAAWALGVPMLLAELYSSGASGSFALFALGAVPLFALASLGRESLVTREAGAPVRASVAASFTVAMVAAAYLALDRGGGLGSFGL